MARIWTKCQNEQLERLWKNGLSISKIASEMGRTRNQVIGRAHRMGLSVKYPRAPCKNAFKQIRRAPNRIIATWAPIIGCEPVSIMDLKPHHCRWPIDGQGYCGRQRSEPTSYCLEHNDLSVGRLSVAQMLNKNE